MEQDGLIVEFLGLPGVGKSTLSHRVAEVLRQKGMPVYEPTYWPVYTLRKYKRIIRKMLFIGWELLGNPGQSWLSAKAILSSKQITSKDLIKTLVAWLHLSSLRQAHSRIAGVHLFDESICQALWSIGFGAREKELAFIANRLLSLSHPPHIVVVLEASLKTIETRLAARPIRHSRLENRLLDDPNILASAADLLKEIKEVEMQVSARHDNMRIMIIDNDRDEDFETNVVKIGELIVRINKDMGFSSPRKVLASVCL
jgi:thymidylate kinase